MNKYKIDNEGYVVEDDNGGYVLWEDAKSLQKHNKSHMKQLSEKVLSEIANDELPYTKSAYNVLKECNCEALTAEVGELKAIIKDNDPSWDGRQLTEREKESCEMALTITRLHTALEEIKPLIRKMDDSENRVFKINNIIETALAPKESIDQEAWLQASDNCKKKGKELREKKAKVCGCLVTGDEDCKFCKQPIKEDTD